MNATREKELSFGEGVYVLRANFASLTGVERVMKEPIFQAVTTIGTAACTLSQVTDVMVEILRANKVKMTREQVGDAVIEFGFNKLLIWIGEFILLGIRTNDDPPGEDDGEGEARPAT